MIIDEDAILSHMAKLARYDWKGHIPYSAARAYLQDNTVKDQYSYHVSKCSYCEYLIEVVKTVPLMV